MDSGSGWTVTAASQAGTSHLRHGEPCADRFAMRAEAGVLVMAVADGAGSARFGADGAEQAAGRAVELACRALADAPPDETLLRAVFQATLDELLAWIGDRRPADFNATLLLAVMTDATLAIGNIGDGWAVVRNRDGGLSALAVPDRGEYVNETFFLTTAGSVEQAVCAVVPSADLDAVALMTDGAAWFSIDLDARVPSAALFGKLFAFAADPSQPAAGKSEELARFLGSELVTRKTDDDTTLMLAVRAGC